MRKLSRWGGMGLIGLIALTSISCSHTRPKMTNLELHHKSFQFCSEHIEFHPSFYLREHNISSPSFTFYARAYAVYKKIRGDTLTLKELYVEPKKYTDQVREHLKDSWIITYPQEKIVGIKITYNDCESNI